MHKRNQPLRERHGYYSDIEVRLILGYPESGAGDNICAIMQSWINGN